MFDIRTELFCGYFGLNIYNYKFDFRIEPNTSGSVWSSTKIEQFVTSLIIIY